MFYCLVSQDHTGILNVELYEVLPLPWSTQSSCIVLFYLSSMDHINEAMCKTIGYEKRMNASQTVLKGKVKQSIVCAPVRISLQTTVVNTVYNMNYIYFIHLDTTGRRQYISNIS